MFKRILVAATFAAVGAVSSANAANDMEVSFSAVESGDFSQAVNIWKDLATQGDAQAQFNLGLMYHGGLGLARNEGEAVTWYEKSANNGYQPAQIYMVVGYEEGWFGLPQDSNKAYYWRGVLGSEK